MTDDTVTKCMKDEFTKMRRKRGFTAMVAREIGLAWDSVNQWKLVPLSHVFAVSRLLGVPPEALRPDFFSEDPLRAPQMTSRRIAWASGQRAAALDKRRLNGPRSKRSPSRHDAVPPSLS